MNLQTAIIVAIAIVIGGVLFSLPTFMKIQRIRRTPTTWMNALPDQGQVEVSGKVSQNITESPLQKTPCAVWKLEVQEEHRNNKGGTYWSTSMKITSGKPFMLEDDLGKVKVVPDSADMTIAEDNYLDTLSPDQRSILKDRFDFDTKGLLGGDKKLRAVERLLVAGDEVYVMGMVNLEDGTKVISAGLSTGSPALTISDQSEEQLIRTLRDQIVTIMLIAIGAAAALVIYFAVKK